MFTENVDRHTEDGLNPLRTTRTCVCRLLELQIILRRFSLVTHETCKHPHINIGFSLSFRPTSPIRRLRL